ncbi:aromatic-ring-hydroxylating dioxygenase subunit beta [Hyphococcus sp.]|jgi:benzoate/toluate 1,2-dioxygenase subunit beta|uniref:aromatic-ring-hydroxylating dioxygenase subunit beta n=1 Tax=Hyphococcus sp. TaxID=2038636 RepID=UPI0035C75A5B
MISTDLWIDVLALIGKESHMLDTKDWDGWLDCYDKDAEYWAPAWDDNEMLIDNPQKEISLIYYPTRAGLEDRVFRIRTGKSSASKPLFRTAHQFSLLKTERNGDRIHATTSWVCKSFRETMAIEYFGLAEYELFAQSDALKIMKKKTIVNNDIATTVMDFYMI